jgi:NTE family protein
MIPGASFFQLCTLIKRIPVFASLNWYRIQLIAQNGELVRYKKGAIVSEKGQQPDYVYFVVSGRLISYTLDAGGRKDDVEFIHRGMFFGIISALTGEVHSQTFEAINDSQVFSISEQKFRKLLKKVPSLGVKFSKILSQRIRSQVTKTDLVNKSTIISVYSPVAGSGGSTYSLNLALSLHKESGEKAILVSIRSQESPEHAADSDLDDVRPKWKMAPRVLSKIENFEDISSIAYQTDFGIDLLNIDFDPNDKSTVQTIADFVSSFIGEYRYVIVDLPSELDDVIMKTLSQSDYIYLVIARKKEALEAGRGVLDRLEGYLKEAFNEDRVRAVVGGVGAHSNISEETARGLLDYDVLAFLPHIHERDLAVMVDTPVIHFSALSAESNYWKTVTRVSRQISGVSVGLVLGGGAAFGLAHIGVIKVLEEENIPIDVVVGSSMGALIASLWAIGYRADELEKMAYEFRDKSSLIKLLDFVFPLSGLISGKAVISWLYNKFEHKTFKDTRLPLKIVAYDLLHRKDLVIEEGLLVDAVRKSISIPGVFQPIVDADQLIIDGGVMNPLPTNVLLSSEVRKIIAVNVLQSPEDVIKGYENTQKALRLALEEPFLKDPWHFIEIRLMFWINKLFFPNISDIIVRTLEASESVIAEQSARAADIVIHPDLSGLNWYELYQAETLIKRGEEAARSQIQKIRDIVFKK